MMEYTTYKWCSENVCNMKKFTYPKVLCVLSDKIEVHTGTQNDCNLEYCKEHNIPVYNLNRAGGTIVCCNGTIGIATFTYSKYGMLNNKFIVNFMKFLKDRGLNVTTDNNDILVDGFKVASAIEYKLGPQLSLLYGCYLISYDVDLDAIRHICKKEMKKIPKGLKEFGLTKEEILNWCNTFFDKIQ